MSSATFKRGSASAKKVVLKRLPNGTFAPKGSGAVLEPGAKVNCVCTHDAVRVLHRSAAVPISDPVAEQVGALSPS